MVGDELFKYLEVLEVKDMKKFVFPFRLKHIQLKHPVKGNFFFIHSRRANCDHSD